ncbi:C-type lectin 37Da-like [Drosophila willistoni]|uniref:C-type lectin 37Da-like n=1 Tax=Drosophila willistoni TaxID=7260 RepID=UPI000C26C394|nr:C-type lectin 37Da-like [Drosophila willistoni]
MFRPIVFLSLLVVSMTYNIKPLIKDGLPGFTDITTAPFLKIGEGYYYIETQLEKNWYDAYETCRLIGAELIAFDSIKEWELVNQYLRDMKIANQPYWTSGTDLANQGKHLWFSNGLSNIFNEIWYPGEPNNEGGNEHCDEFPFHLGNDTSGRTGLNDKNCYEKRRYICEAPQPKTASFIIW